MTCSHNRSFEIGLSSILWADDADQGGESSASQEHREKQTAKVSWRHSWDQPENKHSGFWKLY